VELQRHFNRKQEARNQAAVELALELKLPLLATNGVCYATAAEREILDVFTCIKQKRQLATAGRLLSPNAERYMRTPQQMAQIFLKPLPIRWNFPRGWNFLWKNLATNFRVIRCRAAEARMNSCARRP